MSVAIIAGDLKFGPWIMPHRAQNAVSNSYAASKGIVVDTVIPEPIFSNLFDTTRWVLENWQLTTIILCSFYQLPDRAEDIECFIQDMADLEIHFALEGQSGKGEAFLRKIFAEVGVFRAAGSIDCHEIESYADLHRLMQVEEL